MPRNLTPFDDPLELLLAQAMRRAHVLKPPSDTQTRAIHDLIRSTYANPANWTAGRLVALHHRSADGSINLLGVFQELKYRGAASTRKLCRKADNLEGMDLREVCMTEIEIVKGDHWVHPQAVERSEDNSAELLALRERFDELIKEFP